MQMHMDALEHKDLCGDRGWTSCMAHGPVSPGVPKLDFGPSTFDVLNTGTAGRMHCGAAVVGGRAREKGGSGVT